MTSERRPSSTTPYYKVLLQNYFVLQSPTPVLLRTTNVLQSTSLYYKVLLQYYSVLQTYYKVLLRTTKYYSSTTPYYKVLLCTTKYYFDRNDVRTTSIQYYSVLQSTTPYYKHTTPVLLSTTPVLLRTTNVLQSTTPVLLRTTKYYSVLQTYYSVLQSTTPTETTSERRPSSTTPYYKVIQKLPKRAFSVQNEHFVRGFLNFSRNKLPKRAFRARLPQLFKEQASKTSISCEASSTFQGTSFQNEHFVRGFRNFSRNKLPKRAFRARLPQLFKEQASKTSISCEASATFQGTSFQNEHSSTFQSRSFQSLAPATQNAKMTSHLESLKRQKEHFVRYFLEISHFQLENRRFCASFSYKAIFTELKKYDFCEASATFQDNHQILRLPRYLQ